MARGRFVKSLESSDDFYEMVEETSHAAGLLWLGVLIPNADRYGAVEGSPKTIARLAVAQIPDFPRDEIEGMLKVMEAKEMISFVTSTDGRDAPGVRLLQFHRNQKGMRLRRERRSNFEPDGWLERMEAEERERRAARAEADAHERENPRKPDSASGTTPETSGESPQQSASMRSSSSIVKRSSTLSSADADVERLWALYIQLWGKNGNTKLTTKRRRSITARLKSYAVADIEKALRGHAGSSFHRGENEDGRAYDSPEQVFRADERVEFFRDKFEDQESGTEAARVKGRGGFNQVSEGAAKALIEHATGRGGISDGS